MIITRTPFRISFAGGGTDLPEFYRREYGAVVSTAINRYMYIIVNQRFTDAIRVSYYARTEIVDSVDEIRHPLVREALKLVGIDRGIEIASVADVHAGAGLGSSGSFTVGLLNALYAYKGVLKPAAELAREACRIEIDILGEPVGKQDQYIALTVAYAIFNSIQMKASPPSRLSGRRSTKSNWSKTCCCCIPAISTRPAASCRSRRRKCGSPIKW